MAKKKEKTVFTCGACGHKFEHKGDATEGVACPECGGSDQLSSECVKVKDDEGGDQ